MTPATRNEGDIAAGSQVKAAAVVVQDASGIDVHEIALTLGSGWAKAAKVIGETVAENASSKSISTNPAKSIHSF